MGNLRKKAPNNERTMKKIYALAVCLLMCLTSTTTQIVAQTDNTITIHDITDWKYAADNLRGVTPMKDGESYTQLSSDGRRIVRHSFKTGEETGTLFDVETVRGDKKLSAIDGYIMSPDERRILIQTETKYIYRRSYTAVYYIYDVQNNRMEPLSEGGAQQVPLFSPDGNLIAFARDNNLFLVKLLYGNAETQVTKDGKFNHVLNGIPDWVNEEEFTTNRSFDFSADSKMLAWVRYDESRVPIYKIQEYKGAYPTREEYDEYPGEYAYKYPVAGAKNSDVTVMTFDIKNRVTRTLQVPMDSDGYIPRIRFTSDPEKLAVVTLNRHQDRMDIYMANPRSTECKLALRETNDKYLRETAYTQLRFYDGHFAMLSERSGYQHLYWYTLGGQLERQVTSGDYEVTDFYGYDATTGRFYFAAAKESPLRREIYCAEKSGTVKKLSTEAGTNSATFSTSMKYFINVFSSTTQPPVTTLRGVNGRTLATLIDNADLKTRAAAILSPIEFFTFTTSEGVKLNGYMVKPQTFDASKKYPVIMYQYSGPTSQEVKDTWNVGFYGTGGIFESYLTQQGYICVCVDGRGTGARGADFEKSVYLHLGDLESKDQVEAALYLQTLPYIDKQNIGIWGWSFGGFNTLMSMTDGRPVFKAGVAIAAPSNWKYYDSVYTERYMRTPQENGSGYAVSPTGRADKLSGNLLLIHGTADDNVHFRNVAEMSEALVQAGKQFDMQVYTNRNHSIYGGGTRYHLFNRLCSFFNKNLK